MRDWFAARHPKAPADSDGVYRAAIRAKALDTLRGLLPAATQSNVGMYGTGQAYEALLLRMRAHPLAEARATADAMLTELRKVIPAFLTRVDQPDRGGRWSEYLADARDRTADAAQRLTSGPEAERPAEVTLVDFDPDGELKVVAAALYPVSSRSDAELLDIARRLTAGRAPCRAGRGGRPADEPAAQARPRIRAHELPIRHPHRLRRLPRSAAPSPADDRLAGAHDEPRLHAAGGGRRRRRRRRLARGHGSFERALRRAACPLDCRRRRSTPCRWHIVSGS